MSTTVPSTRERLLQAAGELVEEGGYGAASVVAVAGRAGVATGTLYRHFDSKEHMFAELFRSVCERELAAMARAADQPTAEIDRVVEILLTFARRALQRPRQAWALIAEPVDPMVDAARLAYRERYAALLRERLDGAVLAGEIPAQGTLITAAALVGGCAEVLVGPLAADHAADATLLEAIETLVRRAVGAGG